MTRAVRALAFATYREVVRQPAHGLVLAGALLLLAASPRLSLFALRGEDDLHRDFGTSTVLLAGWLLACIGASGVVRAEIESRTTLTLLAKPVGRSEFLIGKFAGVALALAQSTAVLTVALLLAVRQGPPQTVHHPLDGPAVYLGLGAGALAAVLAFGLWLWRGRSPASSFLTGATLLLGGGFLIASSLDPDWRFGAWFADVDGLVVRACTLGLFAVFVLAAFAISASVWIGRGGTFVASAALFVAGLVLPVTVPALAWCVPDFRLLWAGDVYYDPSATLPWSYVAQAALYAALWVAGLLAVGSLAFRRRAL